MPKKKQKKDPILHEEEWIDFLEKQIAYYKKQEKSKQNDEIIALHQRKLDKARLVLKLLKSKKS